MSSVRTQAAPRRRDTAGFTLIELLTVIAIIAILAAILFPVFAAVREKGRQGTSMSNLQQIHLALTQFQADYHQYPRALFGYVYKDKNGNIVPMDKALTQAQADGANLKQYFPGIYPEFVKDVNIFKDPNNSNNLSKDTGPVSVNVLCNNQGVDAVCAGATNPGQLVTTKKDFYAADSYDVSPQITGTSTLSNNVYVPRYQYAWTNYDPALNVMGASGRNDWLRQLDQRSPAADTYATCTTWHVPAASLVLVLWEDGHAKTVPTTTFLGAAGGQDAPDVSVNGQGVSAANFWKISQNGK